MHLVPGILESACLMWHIWLATYTCIRRYLLNVNKKKWTYRQSTGATRLWTTINFSHSCTWCCAEKDTWLLTKSFYFVLLATQSSFLKTTAKQASWEAVKKVLLEHKLQVLYSITIFNSSKCDVYKDNWQRKLFCILLHGGQSIKSVEFR